MPTQEPTREEVVTKTLDTLDRPDITHPADINNLMTVLLGFFQMEQNKPCPNANQIWRRAVPYLLAYRYSDCESLKREEFPEDTLGAWMKQALRDELRRRSVKSDEA
ncbi:MAG TPA: hypothetical protein VNU02_11290 [Candidatus Dormibacteraeota bacterium]|jgi:hypothetical protein|nr:hypothetical protein [Candidatus Dormibacteraeota bacterium]